MKEMDLLRDENAALRATVDELLTALHILIVQKPYRDGDGAAMFHAENIARVAIANADASKTQPTHAKI